MTTFTLHNQSRKRYYRVLAVGIALVCLVTLIIISRRRDHPDSHSTTLKEERSRVEANRANSFERPGRQEKKRKTFYDTETIISESVIKLKQANGVSREVRGQVRQEEGKLIASYLAVPYAAPPTDKHRLGSPQDVNATQDPLKAFFHPPKCHQTSYPSILSELSSLTNEANEDCLYVNIWTPQQTKCTKCNQSESAKPVLVFLHSGLFHYGGIGASELDPSKLAARSDIVVVTVQYRLGVLGLASSEADSENNVYQSLALQDQAKALEWVSKNIRVFGGNPEEITLAGHGAGAIAASFHLMNSRVSKLVKRAILQGAHNIWNLGLYGLNDRSVSFLMDDSGCESSLVESRRFQACFEANPIKPMGLLETQQYMIDAYPVPFSPESNPLTRQLELQIKNATERVTMNDTLLETYFRAWNIFAPHCEVLLGLNSDDDYQLDWVNRDNRNVKFTDNDDDEGEEEEEGSDDNEVTPGEEDNEEGGSSKEEVSNPESEEEESEETDKKDKDNSESETITIKSLSEATEEDKSELHLGEEVTVSMTTSASTMATTIPTTTKSSTTTSNKRSPKAEDNKDEMEKEETEEKEEEEEDDEEEEENTTLNPMIQRRRRATESAVKLDADEIIKLCRLVRMYRFQLANSKVGRVALYRVEPKVMVNLLEEVTLAFGSRNSWLQGLGQHVMDLWGSFAHSGHSALGKTSPALNEYDSLLNKPEGANHVRLITIGQSSQDDKRSELDSAQIDWTQLCSTP